MEIREATDDDVPAVLEMARVFLEAYPGGPLEGADDDQLQLLARMLRSSGVILVAVDHGLPIGFVAGLSVVHPITGLQVGEEVAWWVEPAHRDAGVGGQLLRAFEAWSREHGVELLRLVAPAGSTIGLFYLDHGYAEVETSYAKRL